jgi:hypothetical protein
MEILIVAGDMYLKLKGLFYLKLLKSSFIIIEIFSELNQGELAKRLYDWYISLVVTVVPTAAACESEEKQ